MEYGVARRAKHLKDYDSLHSDLARECRMCLAVGGLALLFGPDVILPRLIADFPPAGIWLGQLLAAALLALAMLNWLSQSALLGGIYGRAVVMANATLYLVAAMVLLKIVVARELPAALWFILVPIALLAAVYCRLLFRGPVERDVEVYRGASEKSE